VNLNARRRFYLIGLVTGLCFYQNQGSSDPWEVLSNRGIIRTVIYVANYGLIASNLVDQARSDQAVMATLCDFLVKLLQVTPAPDQDPGPATNV